MMTRLASILLASTLPLLPACSGGGGQGYRFDTTFDESIRTVAVPIFRNETTSRGLEVQLTESVMKQLQQRTPWRLAPADRADTTLVAVITDTALSVLSDDPQTGLVQEQAVRITIRFEWRDNRSGDILVARDNYSAAAVFSPARNVGDRIEMGQRNAIEELAHDLVSELRSGW